MLFHILDLLRIKDWLKNLLIFLEKVETKPLNYARAAVKDAIYRGAQVVSFPIKGLENIVGFTKKHINGTSLLKSAPPYLAMGVGI